jgi:DNA-binding transcriptional LysR family regulator
MDLRHIRYFVAVAEEAHFGRAAKRLSIVQPALSMQIRALETELGTALFERTSRRVALTEAGALFRIEAERTLQQAARAKDVAQRAARGEVGSVRIGFVASAAFAGKVSADLSALRLRYPAVGVELTELFPMRQIEAVLSGQLDVGYCSDFHYSEASKLAVERIAAWRWMIALASHHPLAARKTLPAKALRGEAFVVFAANASDDGQMKLLRQILGQEPHVLHRVASTLTHLTLAAAGVGLALVPASLQSYSIPNIVYRPLADFAERAELLLISRPNETSPAVRRFVEIARASAPASGSNLRPPSLKRR